MQVRVIGMFCDFRVVVFAFDIQDARRRVLIGLHEGRKVQDLEDFGFGVNVLPDLRLALFKARREREI